MPVEPDRPVVWRRSSRSGSGGNECVEVALGPAQALVRDSKNPDAGQLAFDHATWSAFVAAVKSGAFDRPH